jgi:hypothetical protein
VRREGRWVGDHAADGETLRDIFTFCPDLLARP